VIQQLGAARALIESAVAQAAIAPAELSAIALVLARAEQLLVDAAP